MVQRESQATKPAIPEGSDDVTAEWLNSALRVAGALDGLVVSAIKKRLQPAGTGGGFFSDLMWIEPQYGIQANSDSTNNRAPAKLVLKRPRSTIDPLLTYRYEREVRYFQHFSDSGPVRVPACYFAEFDAESGNFAILLQDLSDLDAGDEWVGCSLRQAEAAVLTAAQLHAAFWEKPAVEQRLSSRRVPWKPPTPEMWAKLSQDFEDEFPSDAKELAELLAEVGLMRLLDVMSARPVTLIHGDFRLDNMLFEAETPTSRPTIVLLDWQMTRQDVGPADLAWFFAISLEDGQRRAWLTSLLVLYHEELMRHGVSGYTIDDCMQDFRLSLLRTFASAALGHSANRGHPVGDEKMNRIVLRVAAAVADQDCLSLVRNL
jgi:aminoglycoside phosphotransferase (APT) family kinase protein